MSNTQNFRVKNGLDVTGLTALANTTTISGNVVITGNNSLVVTTAGNNVSANIAGRMNIGNTITVSNGGIVVSNGGIVVGNGGINVSASATRFTVNNEAVSISGDLVVTGNTRITGVVSTETTSLLLNDGIAANAAPLANVTIGVNRGSQSNVFLLWDESTNTWKYTNDGVYYFPLRSYNHLVYAFNTDANTDVTPGIGKIKLNNELYYLSNTMTVSVNELGGADVSEFLKLLDNTDSVPRGYITIRSAETPVKFVTFSLDSDINTTSNTLFYSFPLTHVVTSNVNFTANELVFVEYTINGQKGQKGERVSNGVFYNANNTTVFTNSDTTTFTVTGLKGQKGERISNATYTDANNTTVFTNSDTSTFAITGLKGQKGEIGEVSNAVYTDANNTVTFNNDSGSAFSITGVKGQKGQKGERVSNAVYTDANNTVVFTNSDTSTFAVTGTKGQKGDSRGLYYFFDNATSETVSTPGTASVLLNNTAPANVTSIIVRSVDRDSVNNQTYFEYLNFYGNSVSKGFMTIRNTANTAQTLIYHIGNVVSTGVATNKKFNVNAIATGFNSQFPTGALLSIELGAVGTKGEKGQKGEKGEGIANATFYDANNTLELGFSDGTVATVSGVKGAKGDKVVSGSYTDANNTITFTNGDSTTFDVTGIKGQKGEKGEKGQKGELTSSAVYTDTNNTITFINSDTSTYNVTGVKGQKGQKGEKVSAATYTDANNTIIFTNSDESLFAVTGVKGQKGEKGEKGQKGETDGTVLSTVANTSSANIIMTMTANGYASNVKITGSGTAVVNSTGSVISVQDTAYTLNTVSTAGFGNVTMNATGGSGSSSSVKFTGAGLVSIASDGAGVITVTGATPNTFNTPVIFNDYIDIEGVQESMTSVTSPSGTVALNTLSGSLFYITGQTTNWTANFTNVPTTDGYAVTAVVIMNQGSTAYKPTVIQVNGTTQTVKWLGSTAPNASANKVDIMFLTFYRVGGAWIVTGQMNPYG